MLSEQGGGGEPMWGTVSQNEVALTMSALTRTATRSRIFIPVFSSSCPFVISVGATQVVSGHEVTTHQESMMFQRPPLGGGFSKMFPRADFQKNAWRSTRLAILPISGARAAAPSLTSLLADSIIPMG
ncbi:hypothetical protein GY45DRAFT_281095 [Cubamyces sp. BRFM 1775]|nr:hypothetical protein GY45DRAFT_281095 [Cubamyces sp. BRFM 1775]